MAVSEVVGHQEGSVRGEAKTDLGGERTGLGGGVGGRGKKDSPHLTKMVADKASSGIPSLEFTEVFHNTGST